MVVSSILFDTVKNYLDYCAIGRFFFIFLFIKMGGIHRNADILIIFYGRVGKLG